GAAAVGEPPGNRMNVAAGCAANGDLLVIASGWTPVMEPGTEDPEFAFRSRVVLDSRVCRSADGGRTWQRSDTVAVANKTDRWFIPFGDISEGPNGLAVPFYSSPPDGTRNTAWMLRSDDDGQTFGDGSIIAADDFNETDILHRGEGNWLAACRTKLDGHVQLFASSDDGHVWQDRGPLTLPGQHPPHLTHLADDQILLTYGMRNAGLYGIGARISADGGNSWSAPRIIVQFEGATDGGYPSSTQREDGTIVTAYYANKVTAHSRYHMGVVCWDVAD
ncbi:MAG: exo-alpha-sialidase, partial [Gemmatimonadetes bacterium]|nr:exo-alpha-sialidase [Gemmatimonadota bacterium]